MVVYRCTKLQLLPLLPPLLLLLLMLMYQSTG